MNVLDWVVFDAGPYLLAAWTVVSCSSRASRSALSGARAHRQRLAVSTPSVSGLATTASTSPPTGTHPKGLDEAHAPGRHGHHVPVHRRDRAGPARGEPRRLPQDQRRRRDDARTRVQDRGAHRRSRVHGAALLSPEPSRVARELHDLAQLRDEDGTTARVRYIVRAYSTYTGAWALMSLAPPYATGLVLER
jgi:hypothetical protein